MEAGKFDRAVDAYQDMIFRIALNLLGARTDAEDAVQEVLLKLYTAKEPFETEEHLRFRLIRVTVNWCKNVLRNPWRRRSVPLAGHDKAFTFACREQSRLFQKVMALPEKYRIVLYLFYYEELPVGEIAQALRLSTSAVTTRMSRARAALKLTLTEDDVENE